MELSQSSLTMNIGDTETLSATVSPSGQSVTWSSSNTNVATVSNSGTVSAVGSGTATITANFSYGGVTHFASCSVAVKEISITLYQSSLTMNVGDTEMLSANVSPSEQNITWSSNNTNIATVSNSGMVTAKGKGSATITAEIFVNGYSYSDSCTIKVREPYVDVFPHTMTLSLGNSGELLRMTGWELFSDLTWSSSNSSIAVVENITDDSVIIKAVGEGSATITGTIEISGKSYSATCSVTVSATSG